MTYIPNKLLSNQVIVREDTVAHTLNNPLDSTKEYFIDGVVDITPYDVEVPVGGLQLRGYSFDTSKLIYTASTGSMFTSPSGGSGNLLITDVALEATGANTKVFDITGATGFEAVEMNRVNFNDCTSLGEITEYRQGLELGTGRFGGSPELTLVGNWVGGYRATTTIARSIDSGTTLFKAGTGLVLNGRFISDINMAGESGSTLCDFSETNITNDGQFVLINADLRGVVNPLPNIAGTSVKSRFRNCRGIRNTYVGAQWTISAQTQNVISAANTLYKMSGDTAYVDEQWFSHTTDNAFVYDSEQEIEVEVKGVISFLGDNNDQLNVVVRLWDDSASSYVTISPDNTATLNGGGGNRAEGVSILAYTVINQNDRIEVWIENQTDTGNITAEVGGLLSISERPN